MKPLKMDLDEEQLEVVNGGVPSQEDLAAMKKIAEEAGQHHGVNVPTMMGQSFVATVVYFGANAGGRAVHQSINKKGS
jgi:hypothetical protein